MAKIKIETTAQFDVTLTLSEHEARMLHGISKFSAKDFIKVFKEHLSDAEVRTNNITEEHLDALFRRLRCMGPAFDQIAEARLTLTKNV